MTKPNNYKPSLKSCAEQLARRSADAYDSAEAMRFSQASVNVTNAMMNLATIAKEDG